MKGWGEGRGKGAEGCFASILGKYKSARTNRSHRWFECRSICREISMIKSLYFFFLLPEKGLRGLSLLFLIGAQVCFVRGFLFLLLLFFLLFWRFREEIDRSRSVPIRPDSIEKKRISVLTDWWRRQRVRCPANKSLLPATCLVSPKRTSLDCPSCNSRSRRLPVALLL